MKNLVFKMKNAALVVNLLGASLSASSNVFGMG